MEQQNSVLIKKGGPLVISGNVEFIDPRTNKTKIVEMVSLCRCGLSRDMPFCDGVHFKHNFEKDDE